MLRNPQHAGGPSIDHALGEEIMRQILAANPTLRRGDDLPAPAWMVDAQGRAPAELNTVTDMTGLKPIAAKSRRVQLPLDQEIFQQEEFKSASFIHYYECRFNAPAFEVGEETTVMDPATWEPKQVIATEEMYQRSNFALIRFALS